MATLMSRFPLGDMAALYLTDEEKHVGFLLVPAETEPEIVKKDCAVDSLVQVHVRGDLVPPAYGNGHTMCASASTRRMHFLSQEQEGDRIVTTLSDGEGRVARHTVTWHEGLKAVRVSTTFVNETAAPLTLEYLSSVNMGGLTPFEDGDAPGCLTVHRARSAWSAEGRFVCESVESLGLEPSWSTHGFRVERFGQVGSMPVRHYHPFAAVEDKKRGVVWAMQLACPASWEMELRRKDSGLSMTAAQAGYEFGHWWKTLQPGESFTGPEALFTAGRGAADQVFQRLLTIHMEDFVDKDRLPPVMFNEYCTTWGVPSYENLSRIVDCIRDKGMEYLVIDCGWYGSREVPWGLCNGDWIPNEEQLFPGGLQRTVDLIRDAGMKPGIWFEPETCGPRSQISQHKTEWLLKRNGALIDEGTRRFLNMQDPEVKAYLHERVADFLNRYGFAYIKIDYNETIGLGCDGWESPGEGLQQNMQGTLDFFRMLRREVPGLCIECCSSGGNRLEPSFLRLSNMASFSDAHECVEIPIIAANLQKLMLPAQSQIWAVLRAGDSLRRINYSMVNGFLGVLCLSGDVYDLSEAQWKLAEEGISFYKEIRPIVQRGVSYFYGERSESMRHPEGWQAVCRRGENGETLVTVHTFGGELPERVTLPVEASEIRRVLCTEGNEVTLENGKLTVDLHANFEAVAVHLA